MSGVRLCRSILVALVAVAIVGGAATACTRCLHCFADGRVIVGRSMDWMEDPSSEIWCFPRGMKRQGNAGPESLAWTSKYGSVAVSFYGIATVDGMNEKGLVANVLYLAESDYGKPVAGRPNLSIGGWAQYVLDSYATVAEAVEGLRKEPFTVLAPILPNGEAGVGHLHQPRGAQEQPTAVVISGLIRAHSTPSTLWRYWALMSRTARRQASSRPAQRSCFISRQSLAGWASGLSGV